MPILRKKLYRLTDEDKEILRLGRLNLNEITSRWVIHEESGTRYVADPTDSRHEGYAPIYERWSQLGEPEDEFEFKGKTIVPLDTGLALPDFLDHHGFIFIDWQQLVLLAAQTVHVIIGGFGSAKTMCVGMGAVCFALLYPGFDFLNLAPVALQAKEMYDLILDEILDTTFAERFLVSYREAPYPQIIIGHSGVGRCRLMFMPADREAKKAKSMSRDWICLDQAEDQPNLTETSLNLRTRLRGHVRGRARIGRMTYIANSADNDELWEIFDRAEKDERRYLSINVSYLDNPYLTAEQRADMEDVVGDDEDAVAQHLHGQRIEYKGETFPKHLIKVCQEIELDNAMDAGLEDKDRRSQYIIGTQPIVGIHRWMLPYDPFGEYFVFLDGGSSNPPRRNSPALTVWNAAGMPEEPARMVGFEWIFAHGDVMPVFQAAYDAVSKYKAWGRLYMDTTGANKGQGQSFRQMYQCPVIEMSFATMKHFFINDLKFMMSQRLMVWPAKVRGIRQQLARYRLPDERIPQDIVCTMMMAAHTFRLMIGYLGEEIDARKLQETNPYLEDKDGEVVARQRRGRVPRQGRTRYFYRSRR